MKLSPVVRTALFVSNLERSHRFYENILGIEQVFFEGTLDDPDLPDLLGLPVGQRMRAKILKIDGCDHGMVGLFEVTGEGRVVADQPERCARVGQACLVFYCDDLTELHQRLAEGDHRIISAPLPFQAPGRDTRREMTFLDPDGIMINAIERSPVGAFVES